MELIIKINLDNDAFEGDNLTDLAEEVEYCLTSVISKITNGHPNGKIMDSNGNNVGSFTVEE
jgi:hypothetical protein